MAFASDDDRRKAYDLFAKMTWSGREACGYTQELMGYSKTVKDFSSLTEYTTREAYDGAKKSIAVTTVLVYVSIGGSLALVSTALAQRAGIFQYDGGALEYVLIGTILAVVAYGLYAMKRSLSSAIRLYEGNIDAFETPDELIAAMDADSSQEKAYDANAEQGDIDALASLIEKAGDTGSEPTAASPQTATSPSTVEEGGESNEKPDGDETKGTADGVVGDGAVDGTETPATEPDGMEPDGKDTARKGEADAE